jgi:hypothetical protein
MLTYAETLSLKVVTLVDRQREAAYADVCGRMRTYADVY